MASAPFSSVNTGPEEKSSPSSSSQQNTENAATKSEETEKEQQSPAMQYPPEPTPSFILLDLQGHVVVCYVYTLVHGEVSELVVSSIRPGLTLS